MLNRLFIVVGVIVIVVIATAFLAPVFVDWNDYRTRMESIFETALGTEVQVDGDVGVTLLPQPVVWLSDVSVGPENARDAHIQTVEIEFSLMDFLRDRYTVTRLSLVNPELTILIDEEGNFTSSIDLPDTVIASNVSVENAEVRDGSVVLEDRRSGTIRVAKDFDGRIQFANLRGPFSVTGTTLYEGESYDVRLNTSALNPEDAMSMAAFVRPHSGAFSFGIEGLMSVGRAPRFEGTMDYRQIAESSDALDGRGDLVLTAEVEAESNRILLSEYTLLPDENRGAMRMTGAASIMLGAESSFDAVVSGGVVSLAPRDATREDGVQSYEFIRLLQELPPPPIPPMPGQLGLDLAELNLRAFSLRELRLDARTDGEKWTIGGLSGRMQGNTSVSIVGEVRDVDGQPEFNGSLTLDSARLDALSFQWRRNETDANPLFNLSGSISGRVRLNGDEVALEQGRFLFDGIENTVTTRYSFAEGGAIDVGATLGAFDDAHSEALRAFFPDISAQQFSTTVSQGTFDVSAEAFDLPELSLKDIKLAGSWDAEWLRFSQLDISDADGARLDLEGGVSLNAETQRFYGSGQMSLSDDAADGFVPFAMSRLGLAKVTDEVERLTVPAELAVTLTEPGSSGEQRLSITGRAAAAQTDVSIGFSEGIAAFFDAPMMISARLEAARISALQKSLGLGDTSLFAADGEAVLEVEADGTFNNSIEADLKLSGGDESVHFHGNLTLGNLDRATGKGELDVLLSDAGALADVLGASGIGYGPLAGSADLGISADGGLAATNIDAEAQGILISGNIARAIENDSPVFTGDLRLSALSPAMLPGVLGGASSLISKGDVWPDGPFEVVDETRASRGRVSVAAPYIQYRGMDIAGDSSFDLVWDEEQTRIRGLSAAIGAGELKADVTLCCFGTLVDRQVSGRVSLSDLSLDEILPEASAEVLDGVLNGGFTFNATGNSAAIVASSMTGEGSFNLTDLTIDQFDPDAFERVAAIENIVDLEAEELQTIVEDALKEGSLLIDETEGVFNIAGGTLRLANQVAEGTHGRLFGSLSIDLETLALDGKWTMTPVSRSLGEEADRTSQVTALIAGTLLNPGFTLDLGPMIDAIRVRALEIEVDRLEKLRAEQEERAREAAEDRARVMEEQARRRAIEEAERAAAEAERLRQEQRQKALDALIEELGNSQDPQVETSPAPPETEAVPLDLLPDTLDPTFEPQSEIF